MHFCAVLLVSSIMSAPWHQLASAAITVGVFGIAGIVYTAVVMRRVSRQSGYELVIEDWLFHTALPFLAYAIVLAASITLVSHTVDAEFGLASAMLLLLFIGIHNAWDTVTSPAQDGTHPRCRHMHGASGDASLEETMRPHSDDTSSVAPPRVSRPAQSRVSLHTSSDEESRSASCCLRAVAALSGSLTDALAPEDAASLIEKEALAALGATSAVVVTLGVFPPLRSPDAPAPSTCR